MKNLVPKSYQKSAFTLIELLVVIAIIALLAAILFPVFGRARENARKTSCASNLKQIALANIQYADDFDQYLVPRSIAGGYDIGSNCDNALYRTNFCTWAIDLPGRTSLLLPYTKSAQIFNCPSQKKPESYVGYGYNLYLNNDPNKSTEARHLGSVEKPAEMIMFADDTYGSRTIYNPANVAWASNFCDKAPGTVCNTTTTAVFSGDGWPFGRHLEGANVCFVDGHVKWLTMSKLWNNRGATGLYDGK